MLQWLPESSGNLICIKAFGTVTDIDYRLLVPKVLPILATSECLRIYLDFTDLDGWQWAHSADKFPFSMNDVEKIAIIGRELAEKAVFIAGKSLIDTTVRYFDINENVTALNWLKE